MSVILVVSSSARAGRSAVAAAVAYRLGRAGKPVTLARLSGDDSAQHDASTFAALESISSPGKPMSPEDALALVGVGGDIVVEAPAGSVGALAPLLSARVVDVRAPSGQPAETTAGPLRAIIYTRVPAAHSGSSSSTEAVPAVTLAEDRTLAAPSVADIAATLNAEWLAGAERSYAIDRLMIGTISSDAASPYFGEHERTCVITRYDKTDVQLAALLTDLQCLVLTGGGEPSPYLLDRVAREDVAVLRTATNTPDTVRKLEGLYGASRFEGQAKLQRMVELLDAANFPLEL